MRNRLKVTSTVANARAVLAVTARVRLARRLPVGAGGRRAHGRTGSRTGGTIPAETDVSRAMSADLKRRGFRFVGPTVCYAFMQATGMVNDHLMTCFRYSEV